MSVQFDEQHLPATSEDLDALDSRWGATVPQALVAFLRLHDGAIPEPNELDSAHPGGDVGIGIDEFLGARAILDVAARYGDRLGSDAVPIAYAAGGNLVCLSRVDGSVMFWDHELEHGDPFTRVADDLAAFLERLQPFDLGDFVPTAEERASSWINPKFAAEFPDETAG
jgi:hypothetical protein